MTNDNGISRQARVDYFTAIQETDSNALKPAPIKARPYSFLHRPCLGTIFTQEKPRVCPDPAFHLSEMAPSIGPNSTKLKVCQGTTPSARQAANAFSSESLPSAGPIAHLLCLHRLHLCLRRQLLRLRPRQANRQRPGTQTRMAGCQRPHRQYQRRRRSCGPSLQSRSLRSPRCSARR
jgi:hypothetical protein